MGGTPQRAHKALHFPFKRAILSTLSLGGQNPSLDCSWPAPGCFRGRIMREWAQVAEKSARVSTLRGKKGETFLPSTNKQGGCTIHSTFFSSRIEKGAGARYIRQFLSSRQEKRSGRTIHSTNCPFRSLKGGPLMGGTPRRAPKALYLPFKRAILSTLWAGGQNPSLDCS